jgi:lipopolysaccharide assembly protein A
MKILFWLSVLIVAAALALFAISNGETVALGFWPAPYLVEAPLYVAVLVALLLGFLLGEFAACLAAGRWPRETRRRARRIASLEAELLATQAQLAPPAQLASPATPPSTGIAARPAA